MYIESHYFSSEEILTQGIFAMMSSYKFDTHAEARAFAKEKAMESGCSVTITRGVDGYLVSIPITPDRSNDSEVSTENNYEPKFHHSAEKKVTKSTAAQMRTTERRRTHEANEVNRILEAYEAYEREHFTEPARLRKVVEATERKRIAGVRERERKEERESVDQAKERKFKENQKSESLAVIPKSQSEYEELLLLAESLGIGTVERLRLKNVRRVVKAVNSRKSLNGAEFTWSGSGEQKAKPIYDSEESMAKRAFRKRQQKRQP
jgi:hypothetical protein